MPSRRALIGLAALTAIAVAGLYLQSRMTTTAAVSQAPASHYVASDPALVASTGNPQLVEFFHHA